MKLHAYSYITEDGRLNFHTVIDVNNGYLVDERFFITSAKNSDEAVKKAYPDTEVTLSFSHKIERID